MTVTNAQLKTLIDTQTSTTNSNFQKAKQAINSKVDKVSGKGLSTNDFTTELKNKLDGIEAGAKDNVIETVKVNGSALTPDANKAVNVVIPAASEYTIGETTTSSGKLKTYALFKDGTAIAGSIIDIPKDYILKSATIETCATANTPVTGYAVGDPYIDFVFNTKDNENSSTGDSHQYVNLKGLVDIYTAGTGINVSNSNVISIDTSVVAQKSDLPDALSDLTDDLMSGYEKASSASAVGGSDSVKAAIGKLEKALDGKQASGSYAASSHSHVGTEVTLTGYTKAGSASAVAATDTVNAAIGKLEKALDGKQASGSYVVAQDITDTINTVFGAVSITAWDDISLT